MEIDQGTAEQLVTQAERQTKTLQSLYNLGLVWSLVAVLALATLIFVTLAR